MFSRILRQEDISERSVMFWLPPGGRDNGVWASTWVMLAELDSADVEPILANLHTADIGGYAAIPSGRLGLAGALRALYVDRDQLPQATDVVMRFLRGRDSPPVVTTTRRSAGRVRRSPRPAFRRTAVAAAKIVFYAMVIAGMATLAYGEGSEWLAMTHQRAHQLPPSQLPGITNPAP